MKRSFPARVIPLLFLSGAVLFSSACAPAESNGDIDVDALYSSEAPEPEITNGSSTARANPFDQFVLTHEQEVIVAQAREALAAECMAQLGFSYQPIGVPKIDENAIVFDPQWGPLDPEEAKQSGYKEPTLPVVPEGENDTTPAAPQESNVDLRAQTDALAGTGPEDPGCMGEAVATINAATSMLSDADWQEYDRLIRLAYHGAFEDDAVTASVTAWSDCMAQEGYDYSEPNDAMTDAWDLDVTGEEQATAFTDATCKLRVGLMDTWRTTLVEHQTSVIDDHLPFFERMRTFELGRLASAQDIIAGMR